MELGKEGSAGLVVRVAAGPLSPAAGQEVSETIVVELLLSEGGGGKGCLWQ